MTCISVVQHGIFWYTDRLSQRQAEVQGMEGEQQAAQAELKKAEKVSNKSEVSTTPCLCITWVVTKYPQDGLAFLHQCQKFS